MHLLLQFPQVFKPAHGNGIGEIGDALLDQSAIFYLNKTAATIPTFKQQINARIDAIAHFRPHAVIAGQAPDSSIMYCFSDQPVGNRGVDTDQGCGHFNKLKSILQAACRVVVPGEICRSSRLTACTHAPGIGTMGSYHTSILQPYINHKALVAL